MNGDKYKNDGSSQFPTDYVSREVKATDDYTLAWVKAIEQEIIRGNVEIPSYRKREMARSLQYYHGNMSNYKFMQDFGLKEDESGNMVSYSDIDFSPIGFMRVFMKSVYGYLTKERYEYEARGVDEDSIKEKDIIKFRKEILMRDRAFFERIMGRQIQEYVPASDAEFRIFVEENIKLAIEQAFEEHLNMVLKDNRVDQRIEKNLVADLIYASHYATEQTYTDNGRIGIEWVPINELFMPRSRQRDFSDIPWIVRVMPLTIRQLKARVKDRTLTEEQWDDIARRFTGNSFSNCGTMFDGMGSLDNIEATPVDGRHGKYDHYVIPVMQAYKMSTEYAVSEATPNPYNGETILRSRSFEFKAKGDSRRVEKEWVNIYGALWIVKSDYVFNVGSVKNLVRSRYDRSRPCFPITVTKISSDSLTVVRSMTETLKPIEHMLQSAWLKLQNELAAALPDMTVVEMDFIMNGLKKGIEADNAQEALDALFQTGKLVGSATDQDVFPQNPARSSSQPVYKVPGGLGQAFSSYVQCLQMGFMIMERVIGRSPMQIGQTPHPDTGKKVAEMTASSANEMLQDMVDAYQLGIQNMVEHISEMIMRLSDYRTADEEFAYRRAFSKLTNNIMLAAKGMNLRDMGIIINKRFTEQEVAELLRDIQIGRAHV